MRIGKSAVVIGAGLAGAAAAWQLTKSGYRVRVFERLTTIGGHVRTEWYQNIPYEPHGPHIFHTADAEIWRLVTGRTPFKPYRHKVLIRVQDQYLSWPLQVGELHRLQNYNTITAELASRPTIPDMQNFESYCVSLLGRTLFDNCVRDYTRKQWDRDPSQLAASIAIGRVEIRNDGDPFLFRDPYQGWPQYGYGALIEALLEGMELFLGEFITIKDIPNISNPGEPIIITSALDDFFDESNALNWRGVRLVPSFIPGIMLAQGAMVVNEPSLSVPWTRTIETKWALPELHDMPGTIVMRELPGAEEKHYPVLDSQGNNLYVQGNLLHRLTAEKRNRLYVAGRLATYKYINMDIAIRSGLDAASRLMIEH